MQNGDKPMDGLLKNQFSTDYATSLWNHFLALNAGMISKSVYGMQCSITNCSSCGVGPVGACDA